MPGQAERALFFPVCVRVAVPAEGFGRQYEEMRGWLDQHVGEDNYAVGGIETALGVAAMRLDFLDARAARAYLGRFCCGLAIAPAGQERFGADSAASVPT
jgi:hypothetical protein